MTLLRSLLFVPGNRPNMLEKALGVAPDAYVPDLEDSVPQGEKGNAREITSSYLSRLAAKGPLVVPRVNPMDTGLLEKDLSAVVGPDVYGVSVGKVSNAQDVHRVSRLLEELERTAGLKTGLVRLVVWIESAIAVVNAPEICSASPRVVAVAFGAEDYTNDMGIQRTEDGSEVAYPRSVVCVAAQAAGILALDTPYFRFREPEGLRRDARLARTFGFRGKFAIHPSQIDIINESFGPTQEEIESARRVVAAFEEAERSGWASTSLDGVVIDVPVAKRARTLLELAEQTARRQPLGD